MTRVAWNVRRRIGGVMRALPDLEGQHAVRRELLRIERTDENPRTPLYYTTDRFLDLFGMASIDELPQSQEFDVSD